MQAQSAEESFRSFLEQMEEATNRFVNGDPSLWKELCSHREDVTIYGGWGAYEKGWEQVGPRYEWAAARFIAGQVAVEYIATGVSGDLAYTMALERSTVRLAGAEERAPMVLRVTHIFRREEGVWKLLHRHADPLMGITPPAAVLQQ
jgi:ketosteroid isomerase-like protein